MENQYLPFYSQDLGTFEINFIRFLSKLPAEDVPMINLPNNAKITISIALSAAIIVGTYFKSILYRGIFAENWMDKPINVLIFVSALIHHATSLLTSIHLILILSIESSLNSLFGPFYCFILPVIGEIGIFNQAIGSFGICIYRMMYIKLDDFVKYKIGEKTLLSIILFLGLSMNGVITFLHMVEESSLRIAQNTCNHWSPEEAQALIDYRISSGDINTPENTLQKMALVIIMIIQSSEFVIYIYFFIWQHLHNNGRISLLMDPKDVRKRNTTNVITFIGQFYGFLVEGTFIAIFLLLTIISRLDVSPSFNNFVRSVAVIAHFLNFGVLSAVEVLVSPSLRALL